jgi:dienelactone hydrolase
MKTRPWRGFYGSVTACLLLMFIESAAWAEPVSFSWESALLEKSISCEIFAPKDPATKMPPVVYLKNLPSPRIGQLDDETLIEQFVKQGMIVFVADYENDPRAVAPELLPEIDLWYGYLSRTEDHPVDRDWIYIVPEGYAIDRKVEICEVFDKPVGMDVIYPSGKTDPVPLMLQITSTKDPGKWINQRAYYIYGLLTTGYAGAIMDYNGGDRVAPVGRVFPEKQAARLLRANAKKWNLSGKLGVTGHSKGSSRAAKAAFVNGPEFEDDPGPHADQSSRFQVVLASAGQHAKEFLIEDGYLDEVGEAKRESALRQQEAESIEEIRINSTNAYVTPDDPPAFLCVGELDKKFRVAQMKRLAAQCEKVGLEHRLIVQKGMDHMYIPNPEVIGEIFAFFDKYLKPSKQGWVAAPEVEDRYIARDKDKTFYRDQPADIKIIYREEDIPPYTLPDALEMNDGSKVTNAETWRDRRLEILELFREHIHGREPVGRPGGMKFELGPVDRKALDGKATQKDLAINFTGKDSGPRMDMRVYTPNGATGPVPCFLYLGRPMSSPQSRFEGVLPEIMSRGYALAVVDREGIDPDDYDEFKNGVHGAFDPPGERAGDAWGTISAWAWGLSRALDYLETDKDVDSSRVAVMGVSRGGKTALWAGAQDERFAMTISVCSGCTGAALSRRRFGNPVNVLNGRNEHWYCENYRQYGGNEDALPVDQHMLLSLVAPRLLYVNSADTDLWADPRGEFLGAKHADPVYHLLGVKGLEAEHMPAIESPVQTGRVGYHIRTGGHGLETYDWLRYLDFADMHWKEK